MAYGSLFERLTGELNQRASWSQEQAATASVAAHLAKMLSTRAGSVQTLLDYGLPDLCNMNLSLHDALQQARFAIERFIEAYEPRLSQVRVVALPRDPNPLNLAFAIEGLLNINACKYPVRFSATLDGAGQVKVH